MKKFLLILLGVIVLAAVGLTIYIASIDWNEHKGKISEQFLNMTGKEIIFEGPVSFKLLPSPYLTATNVKIYNQGTQGEKPLVEIKDLVANLALSPLLQGAFDIKRMVLNGTHINIEMLGNNTLNWQSPLTLEQRENLSQEQIRLNSVSLVDATLNYEDPYRNVHVQLDNLNGEVVAQSVFGPYRIEGNYVKDNNPEGFALSVGKIVEGFATTVNLAISHPASKSFVRFDGSVLLDNNAVNGNVVIDSENLQGFAKANFKDINFDKAYNYPLALNFDIYTNDVQIDLSNIVVKYGETQGAGNMQIPMMEKSNEDEQSRNRLEMTFNFTNFNLDPVIYAINNFVNSYKDGKKAFIVDWGWDVLADIKSLKTQYQGQPIKDFATSVDVVNNEISVKNLKATLPGDTDFKINGTLYAEEGIPTYSMDINFNSSDFLKTLKWLRLEPQVTVSSTYRKALGSAKVAGNMKKIQISPFNLTIDKSSLSGDAGFKLGERNDAMLILQADMINFDNYIAALPREEQEKTWTQRMQYRFAKLNILNDFEMEIAAKIDLGIYESMPFEKVDFKATLLNGNLDITKLDIGSVANAQLGLSGVVKGFGGVPAYENLKYSIKAADVAALINKFEFKAPNLDYKELKTFESQGIATGSLEKFAVKAVSRLQNLDFTYSGQVTKDGDGFLYNGDLEAKHPDFVKMLNTLNVKYNPDVYSLGAFNLKSKINGKIDNFVANPLDVSIGFNNFKGEVIFDKTRERPSILTNLEINKLEIERFLSKAAEGENRENLIKLQGTDDEAEFLSKPFWGKSKFNFDFYRSFDLNGKFKVVDFSYKKYALQGVEIDLGLVNGALNLSRLNGVFKNGGSLESNLNLNMMDKPQINGRMKLGEIDLANLALSGSRYGLTSGKMTSSLSFNAAVDSSEMIADSFSGNLDFNIDNVAVKGWNLEDIYKDIVIRDSNDGLVTMVKDNLQKGMTSFNSLQGKMTFNKGAYSLSETMFKGSGVTLGVFGDGNLNSWDMNVLFNVKYDEPKFLPGYSFSLKGPMNAPLIDVNVSALYELYKSRNDKVKEQEKAVEDANAKRLQDLAAIQRQAAQVILDELQSQLQNEILNKKNQLANTEILLSFNKLQSDVEEQIKAVGNIVAKGQAMEADETLITEMTELNQQAVQNLEVLKKQLQKLLVGDWQSKMDAPFNQLIELYNDAKVKQELNHQNMEKWKSRLAVVETNYNLTEDKEIIAWQQFIDDKTALLDGQNNPLLDNYAAMQKSQDITGLEEYVLSLEDLLALANEDMEALQDGLTKLNEYVEAKVSTEEKTYQNMLREEEVQRKVEENTGMISNKKTGVNVVVQRDIEDIEKAQELAKDEKVKVLDFSKKKSNVVVRRDGNKNLVKRRK